MAASTIKGITIEIGGDTTKLDKALSGVNKQSRDCFNLFRCRRVVCGQVPRSLHGNNNDLFRDRPVVRGPVDGH